MTEMSYWITLACHYTSHSCIQLHCTSLKPGNHPPRLMTKDILNKRCMQFPTMILKITLCCRRCGVKIIVRHVISECCGCDVIMESE